MENLSACTLDGNADLYGLGIRLGVYCSLSGTIYAKYYLPQSLEDLSTTNVIFVLAILIAIVKNASASQLSPVEAYVMLQVILGFILCGAEGSGSLGLVNIIWSAIAKEDIELVAVYGSRKVLSDICLDMLRTATASLNVWFWFSGRRHLPRHQACVFQVFFFRSFDGNGSIRIFFQVLSTIYLTFQVVRHYFSSLAFIYRFKAYAREVRKQELPIGHGKSKPFRLRSLLWEYLATVSIPMAELKDTRKSIVRSLEALNVDLDDMSVSRVQAIASWTEGYRNCLAARDTALFAYTILAIELSLGWSHVDQVYNVTSTGQLIPLVIGVASILSLGSDAVGRVVEKSKLSLGLKGITEQNDQRFWRYRLQDGSVIRFKHNTQLSRRWSTPTLRFEDKETENISQPHQLPSSIRPPEAPPRGSAAQPMPSGEVESPQIWSLRPARVFSPTPFPGEWKGPSLSRFTSQMVGQYRYYVPSKGKSKALQVFDVHRPEASRSCPENLDELDFQPWRLKLLWRDKRHDPLVAHVYRGPRSWAESAGSRSMSDVSRISIEPPVSAFSRPQKAGPKDSGITGDSPSAQSEQNPRLPWTTKLFLMDQVLTTQRYGARHVAEIRIYFNTGRHFTGAAPDKPQLEIPCHFEELLYGPRPFRRWSFDMNEDTGGGPSRTSAEFGPSRVTARSTEIKTRAAPWSSKRRLQFYVLVYVLVLLEITVLVLSAPMTLPMGALYFAVTLISEGRDSTRKKESVATEIREAGRTVLHFTKAYLWHFPRVVAHGSLLKALPKEGSNWVEEAYGNLEAIPYIPSVLSLFLIGLPLYLILSSIRDINRPSDEMLEDEAKVFKRLSRPKWPRRAAITLGVIFWPVSVPLFIAFKTIQKVKQRRKDRAKKRRKAKTTTESV